MADFVTQQVPNWTAGQQDLLDYMVGQVRNRMTGGYPSGSASTLTYPTTQPTVQTQPQTQTQTQAQSTGNMFTGGGTTTQPTTQQTALATAFNQPTTQSMYTGPKPQDLFQGSNWISGVVPTTYNPTTSYSSKLTNLDPYSEYSPYAGYMFDPYKTSLQAIKALNPDISQAQLDSFTTRFNNWANNIPRYSEDAFTQTAYKHFLLDPSSYPDHPLAQPANEAFYQLRDSLANLGVFDTNQYWTSPNQGNLYAVPGVTGQFTSSDPKTWTPEQLKQVQDYYAAQGTQQPPPSTGGGTTTPPPVTGTGTNAGPNGVYNVTPAEQAYFNSLNNPEALNAKVLAQIKDLDPTSYLQSISKAFNQNDWQNQANTMQTKYLGDNQALLDQYLAKNNAEFDPTSNAKIIADAFTAGVTPTWMNTIMPQIKAQFAGNAAFNSELPQNITEQLGQQASQFYGTGLTNFLNARNTGAGNILDTFSKAGSGINQAFVDAGLKNLASGNEARSNALSSVFNNQLSNQTLRNSLGASLTQNIPNMLAQAAEMARKYQTPEVDPIYDSAMRLLGFDPFTTLGAVNQQTPDNSSAQAAQLISSIIGAYAGKGA